MADSSSRNPLAAFGHRLIEAVWKLGFVCRFFAAILRDVSEQRRAREALLNRFEQFSTPIDGLDIHFIHQRSSNPNAFPLIITHGWPGSIVEFHKVIEPLAADFHVVCPSLPGYGFSGKPSRTGWSVEKVADAWATLMARLGYESYGAQGGDWGSAVTAQMGRNGRGCKAIHINMPLGFPTPESAQNPTAEEAAAMAAIGTTEATPIAPAKPAKTLITA